MVDEQPVEEGLVAIVQRGEADVALEVVPFAPEVLELEGHLLAEVRRRHGARAGRGRLAPAR